jgi:hypothetical protein
MALKSPGRETERAIFAVPRGVGRATAGARMTPAFLIVGAQRCGTTSLYKALSQHPSILRGIRGAREVHYFDTDYWRGMSWYLGHFPLEARHRWVSRRLGSPVVTFESTPYYMFHPLAAQRVAADLPNVQLLVLLRDPVERAYSAYAHERAQGYETETFDRAIELEESRTSGEEVRLLSDPSAYSFEHHHHSYLARGRYVDQLERLANHHGRENIKVLQSEEFFHRPAEVFRSVEGFLGLPPCETIVFDKHNSRPRSSMDPDLRRHLEEHFEPHDARLAAWLGYNPFWRL